MHKEVYISTFIRRKPSQYSTNQLDGKIFYWNHNIESGSNSILKIEGVLCNITCLDPFSDDICIAKGKLRARLCKDERIKSVHLRHN